MKSVKEFFSRAGNQNKDKKDLENESKDFRTPSELLPQILKFAFFAGLGFLNYRLFSATVPGLWGHATGIVAVMAESIALYSTHNFSRSSGAFRFSLGICGAVLMVFTVTHATFSFLDLVNVAEISETVHGYARVVAFPLLASLLGLSVIAITMTHPKNRVRLQQARAHTEVLIGRARAASELALMRAQSILDQAGLEHQREKTAREEEYLVELNRQIETEQRKIALVASIPDRALREKMARELGIDPQSLADYDQTQRQPGPGYQSSNWRNQRP